MSEFDAVLKRAFAEAREPQDQGFSQRVAQAVVSRQRAARAWAMARAVGLGLAGLAMIFAISPLVWFFGQEALAGLGLGLARAQGALSADAPAQLRGVGQMLGLGMSQILLIGAALAGGAVAYRSIQE